jgi:hypothetical protein
MKSFYDDCVDRAKKEDTNFVLFNPKDPVHIRILDIRSIVWSKRAIAFWNKLTPKLNEYRLLQRRSFLSKVVQLKLF